MEFHISRAVRNRLDIDELLFSLSGDVVFGNVAASRKLAKQLNDTRGPQVDLTTHVNAGALFAMGLIDELNHLLIARYRSEIDRSVMADAIAWFAARLGASETEQLLLAFTEQFPNVAVYRQELSKEQWLDEATDGIPNREVAFEELLLLWLANQNPAVVAFRELFADSDLREQTVYESVTSALASYFGTRPLIAPEAGSLLDVLLAPMLASPDSLGGQLEYIRAHWAEHLDHDLRRLLLGIDVLREEDLAIWMRFHPPAFDRHTQPASGGAQEGFIGNEFIGFDEEFIIGPDGLRHRRYAADYQAPLHQYEAFSADQNWMPTVVMLAKNTYVWLEQLSKKYGRHIHQLNHIPTEELEQIAGGGVTALWLIGLWERSVASRTIKRLRGQSDAVASAYSLKGYEIAQDLGGQAAYENLRDRAAGLGMRLASDMVPNHMGLDSDWVIEHPDWFLHHAESPFPSYRFEGPDLSNDSRVEIKIEDHYYDESDAAVSFRLRHHGDGHTRYIYHGNDGTTFAWNDTAQLDYSKAAVREHVIQTIFHVARLSPIIRFDAAMVLAKRHVQRLWFPLPGAGGSIPSRAESAISQEEFDALMPHEFWREVVDRVAAEVPGTLLLAEAFWMLEGYFVRTLGMHRVYNSAFMNMLRDEENEKYRSYLKKTIEFDADILKRYVNFMSNPDERTAKDQFGSGDKYFGVCTLLATLPGLPMIGHGQIEGFEERYRMDFKRARMDEYANDDLVARHQREIAPLLKNRQLFAESAHFVLYDFKTGYGTVNENVFAYSNRWGGQRALVVYNNSYSSTSGTIRTSAGAMGKGSASAGPKSLADGLALPFEDSLIIAYRDAIRGLEYLRRATDLHNHGFSFDLRGYQYVVLLDWQELHSTADEPWNRLCDALNGEGVFSVREAMSKLRLLPLHEALHQALGLESLRAFASSAQALAMRAKDDAARLSTRKLVKKTLKSVTQSATHGAHEESSPRTLIEGDAPDPRLQLPLFVEKGEVFFERISTSLQIEVEEPKKDPNGSNGPVEVSSSDGIAAHGAVKVQKTYRQLLEASATAAVRIPGLLRDLPASWPEALQAVLPTNDSGEMAEQRWAPVIAWLVLHSLPSRGVSGSLFDTLYIRSALAETFSAIGMKGEATWRAAALVRILLAQANKSSAEDFRSRTFWADPEVRWLAGVHESGGTTFFNKECFEEMLIWLQVPALIEILKAGSNLLASAREVQAAVNVACRAAQSGGYDLDKCLVLWKAERVVREKASSLDPPAQPDERASVTERPVG